MQMNEKYLEILKRLRLIDDIFFSIFFENNPADVEYILRIILNKPDLKVLKVQTQKNVENIYGRSVRFDVFATDDKNKLYNIEVQRADSGAVPTRARYNSSMLDYHELKKQTKFDELPETFVIFITENDVLKDGEQIYHIDRVIRETKKICEDGTHIIYVNGSYKDESGSELGNLIHDFFCENPDEMKHKRLSTRAKFLKNNEQEERKMSYVSDIFREVFKDEFEEHEKNTLLENIRKMMANLHLTAKQAMDALEIPEEKQREYAPLI